MTKYYKLVTLDGVNGWKELFRHHDWITVETVQKQYESQGISVHRVIVTDARY